jgi:hypothetical protein
MKVSVVADLMAFDNRAVHEIRPSFRMGAQNEERRANSELGERIEDARSCVRIGTVIERQAHLLALGRQLTKHTAEHFAVSVECSMRESAEQ